MPKFPAPPGEKGHDPIRFRLLGPLRVETEPQPGPGSGPSSGVQSGPGPAKHRAVLVALLVSAGRVVPIERLMAVVWDDRPPASAESVLRVYISALRKLVDGIRTVPGGYLIEVEPDAVD